MYVRQRRCARICRVDTAPGRQQGGKDPRVNIWILCFVKFLVRNDDGDVECYRTGIGFYAWS